MDLRWSRLVFDFLYRSIRRFKLVFLILMLGATSAQAADVQLTTTGWTQSEINLIPAAVFRLLFENGISHSGVSVNLPAVSVESPSASINVITTASVKAKIDAIEAASLSEQAANIALQAEYNNIIESNDICSARLVTIDAKIDAMIDPIVSVASAKTQLRILFKEMARCYIARFGFR